MPSEVVYMPSGVSHACAARDFLMRAAAASSGRSVLSPTPPFAGPVMPCATIMSLTQQLCSNSSEPIRDHNGVRHHLPIRVGIDLYMLQLESPTLRYCILTPESTSGKKYQ
eukprot:CAMPEP_0203957164 /NCGR_PEP_ID=MMETSP0359-20131031/89138_1 /ASSEMBLY_ACC=CAM_ASM_000338 /TAXON_ID=268821 /ORGANISM="Scrippsiella Hangoei, Strain SHTV-5" /LENGTH=110 /DNA_ID=CAMNT_0050890979 /DNA_START=155 /DNA_END=487 /DNA_ORIENTATION=+